MRLLLFEKVNRINKIFVSFCVALKHIGRWFLGLVLLVDWFELNILKVFVHFFPTICSFVSKVMGTCNNFSDHGVVCCWLDFFSFNWFFTDFSWVFPWYTDVFLDILVILHWYHDTLTYHIDGIMIFRYQVWYLVVSGMIPSDITTDTYQVPWFGTRYLIPDT